MNANRIFVGNIMKCTKYDEVEDNNISGSIIGHREINSEIYKEDAILLKTRHGYYVDIEGLSFADIVYLYFENAKGRTIGSKSAKLFMSLSPLKEGDLFVSSDPKPKSYVSDSYSVSIRDVQIKLQTIKNIMDDSSEKITDEEFFKKVAEKIQVDYDLIDNFIMKKVYPKLIEGYDSGAGKISGEFKADFYYSDIKEYGISLESLQSRLPREFKIYLSGFGDYFTIVIKNKNAQAMLKRLYK